MKKKAIEGRTAEEELAYALMLLADCYRIITGSRDPLLTKGGRRVLLRDVAEFLERNSEGG